MQYQVIDVETGQHIQDIVLSSDVYANNEYLIGLVLGLLIMLTFWTVAKGGYQ